MNIINLGQSWGKTRTMWRHVLHTSSTDHNALSLGWKSHQCLSLWDRDRGMGKMIVLRKILKRISWGRRRTGERRRLRSAMRANTFSRSPSRPYNSASIEASACCRAATWSSIAATRASPIDILSRNWHSSDGDGRLLERKRLSNVGPVSVCSSHEIVKGV